MFVQQNNKPILISKTLAMKQTTKFLFSFFTLVLFTLIGCKSDDNGGGSDNGAADGEVQVTIDGSEFSVGGSTVGAAIFNGIFNFSAVNTVTGETLTITISDAVEGSTYDIGENNTNTSGAAYVRNGEAAFLSNSEGGSGQFTLTKLDIENKLASGVFSFVGARQSFDDNNEIITETITFTDGSFNNVTLETELATGANNSFEAKIDGVDFNPDAINAIEVTLLGNTSINISAISSTRNDNIGITLPGDIEVGTYDFTSVPIPGAILAQYNVALGDPGAASYVSIEGQIVITNIDTNTGLYEGTFEFTAGDFLGQDDTTFEITEGSFSVELL